MRKQQLGRSLNAHGEITLLVGKAGLEQKAIESDYAVDRGSDLMGYLQANW